MIATFDNDLEEVKLVGDRTATLNSEDDEEEHSGNGLYVDLRPRGHFRCLLAATTCVLELCPKVEDNETSK